MAALCMVHNKRYRGDGSGMCDARTPKDGEHCTATERGFDTNDCEVHN